VTPRIDALAARGISLKLKLKFIFKIVNLENMLQNMGNS